jgi:hypothetical protein
MDPFVISAAIVNLVDIFAHFGHYPGRLSIEVSLSHFPFEDYSAPSVRK